VDPRRGVIAPAWGVVVVLFAAATGCRESATVFADDFESGSLAAWQDGVDPSRQRVVRDPSGAESGERYLEVTYPEGRDGGWLTRFLGSGYDSLYVSYYVRFPRNWRGSTKLIALYGSRTDDRWSAMGRAGKCPTGADFFETAVVTDLAGDPGPLRFYTYYPAMATQPDGVTCYGVFGDASTTYAPLAPSPGVWHHVELWVTLNAPGQPNGCESLWLDGVRRGTWSGLIFRTSAILELNVVQLSFSNGGAPVTQHLDVDNLTVARAAPQGVVTCGPS
jgi:polysaccharide lyase-like protein